MTKKTAPELKVESVSSRGNLIYLALVEYKREQYLCVIDTIKATEITAYVLDFAEQENIKLPAFISFSTRWFYSNSDHVPISIELAKHGLTNWAMPIYRTFDKAYVSRVIGKTFDYESKKKTKVKRRRVIALPEGIAITLKKTTS